MQIGKADFSIWGENDVLIWQYCNAPNLAQIIENEFAFYNKNVRDFFNDWYNDVFNLLTANTFGLNVWANILGVKRPSVQAVNGGIDKNGIFRFKNVDTGRWHSVWISGTMPQLNIESSPLEDSIPRPNQLDDESFRRCLLAKLKLLHSNASIVDINDFLQSVLGEFSPETGWKKNYNVYIQDYYDMTMNIVFNKELPSAADLSIITNDDFSPRPMGVMMNYGFVDIENTFGWNEAQMKTWLPLTSTGDVAEWESGYGALSQF